ncbi:MAG TPA: hypothetical protein VFL04_06745 [Rectinemataceae bacterium]|nr:hypothetical protein [Rectinemataceae bacterium]
MAASPLAAATAALARVWRGILDALPFVKRGGGAKSSEEPFSTIEDPTSTSDMLLEANAAMTGAAAPREARIDLRASLAALAKNTVLVVSLLAILGFLLVLAVTAIIVGAPPKPMPAAPALSREGTDLVKTWIYPPGLSLEPRMPMEREGRPKYSYGDSARIGIDPAKVDLAPLKATNDEAIDELYRTVR